MNENYLQFIWKVKRIPFHLIKTTTNQAITIKNVGIHNTHESGPDFTNGRILLNGIEWAGNIEIHIKSSDWNKHNHHHDSAYENVILHVVLHHDMEILVNGSPIPTIELKDHIDREHFENWQYFADSSQEINCRKSLSSVESVYLESMMERALWDRLNRKTFFLKQVREVSDPKEMLYFLFARAFGVKVNQLPFEELTQRLPLSIIKSVEKNKQGELILATSGFEPVLDFKESSRIWVKLNRTHEIGRVACLSWKRKGLRPQSHPGIRLKQFATLIENYDFEIALKHLETDLFIDYTLKVLDEHLKGEYQKLTISESFKNLIIINAIVPFIWWYAEEMENDELKSKAISVLESTKAESNTIIKTWKLLGVKVKNGYQSQALIELYNEHCMKNKCLSCEIGVQLLK